MGRMTGVRREEMMLLGWALLGTSRCALGWAFLG